MTFFDPRTTIALKPDVEVIRNGAGDEVAFFSPFPASAPEPIAPAIRHGIEAGATRAELAADTPIFQTLIREAVQQQVRYEEDQLREWLRALIENPAGRKIIEDML